MRRLIAFLARQSTFCQALVAAEISRGRCRSPLSRVNSRSHFNFATFPPFDPFAHMPCEEEIYQDHILDHYEDPFHRGICRRRRMRTRTRTRSAATWCGSSWSSTDDGKIQATSTSTAMAASSARRRPRCCSKSVRQNGRRREGVFRRGHAQALRARLDAEPAEVLSAVLEGAAVGGPLAELRVEHCISACDFAAKFAILPLLNYFLPLYAITQ